MTVPRSHWWCERDARRAIARAEFVVGGGKRSRDELTYLLCTCELILSGLLPLVADDRDRVQRLRENVLAALDAQIGAATPADGRVP
jgi:hypothetical protein